MKNSKTTAPVKSTEYNTQNLKPAWKPGQSGNVKGRPKKKLCLTDVLREYSTAKDATDGETRLYRLVVKVWEMALSGDMAAINFIADRLEGKPRQALEIRPEREKCTLTVIN